MFDTISNIKDLIMDVFRNTGQYCSDIIDASLKCFNALVNAGSKMLSYKVENTTFSDLWGIINLVARIMGGVASALIVLFFLYNLMDDSLENRPDQGLTILVKNFSYMCIGIAVSNNAIAIISKIFNSGAIVAKLLYRITKVNIMPNNTIELDDVSSERLIHGVTGLKGLFVLLIYVLGALIIIGAGFMILVAVYKRIFRLFILMPFGSFSFSAITLAPGRGRDIFSGYLRSLVATAIESIVIMMGIMFSLILISSGQTLSQILPDSLDANSQNQIITIRNSSELNVLYYSYSNDTLPLYSSTFQANVDWNELSDEILNVIQYDRNKNVVLPDADTYINLGLKKYEDCYMTIDGRAVNGRFYQYCFGDGNPVFINLIRMLNNQANNASGNTSTDTSNQVQHTYPMTLIIYSELSWYGILIILLRMIVPCILAAGIVQEAKPISNTIMGR